ncbi:hypothetical protein [uncultured Microbacterium sp.]|uniref:hypothetical protein n=1 Tax=uncultured Microbacterium sp. TaxID=191216 RepID=UPI0025D1CF04|nr:hypothetical protein [uncultured Microbacterium sp.]
MPEGYEDLQIDGDVPLFVQVKSRQERRGSFTLSETGDHLVEMWEKHRARGFVTGRLILVVERPVAGEVFDDLNRTLSDLDASHPLRSVIAEKVGPDLAELLTISTILTLDWQLAHDQAVTALADSLNAARAACEFVERSLRIDVANAADANAAVTVPELAVGIDRSEVRHRAESALRLLDADALSRAITDGTCVPVRFVDLGAHDDYYAGTSARPEHIAAGLPAPMPDAVGDAVTALSAGKPVLFVGPSGVGKSTAVWSAVYTRRDVVWYEVRRTDTEAIRSIVDLAVSFATNDRNQIGFVLDGVGTGQLLGWDELVDATSHLTGVMTLGSVRNEDLIGVRDTARCALVRVSLTEQIAEALYVSLQNDRLTSLPHWREAYDAADGLTLEYTYMLTRGRRLGAVLRDQVMNHICQGRETELRVLALVSTASQWGAALSIPQLESALPTEGALRRALLRLAEEHLVLVSGETVRGLHPLRSRLLSKYLHEAPPPSVAQTIQKLVSLVAAEFLPTLLVGIARDAPAALPSAINRLQNRLAQAPVGELITGLQAVKLADLQGRSEHWLEVLNRNDVPPPSRVFTLQLAIVDGDWSGMPFPQNVAKAVSELREVAKEPFPGLATVMRNIGVSRIMDAVFSLHRLSDLESLFSAIHGADPELLQDIDVNFGTHLDNGRRPASFSQEPPLEALAELTMAARMLTPGVAEGVTRLAGGADRILDRLTERFMGAHSLFIVDSHDGKILHGSIIHVSDAVQGDADRNAKELARLGVACIPSVDSADISTKLPGGNDYRIGDMQLGISKLQRRSLHARSSVASNRQTANLAAARLHQLTRTERVSVGEAGLRLADAVLDRTALIWLRGETRSSVVAALQEDAASLAEMANRLVPVVDSPLDGTSAPPSDDLHSVLSGIALDLPRRLVDPTGHRALAMYLSENLVEAAIKCKREPWDLIAEDPSDAIDRIVGRLEDLSAILETIAANETSGSDIRRAARSGESGLALARAGTLARRNGSRTAQRQRDLQLSALRELGLEATSYERATDRVYEGWPPQQRAVGIKVPDPLEWFKHSPEVLHKLTPDSGSYGYRPPLIVFPEIGGYRVDRLAFTIIRTAHSSETALDDWTGLVPPAWTTPRSDAYKAGIHAATVLSGLEVMRRYHIAHDVAELRARFQLELDQAVLKLQAFDNVATDVVAKHLDTIRSRLVEELEDLTQVAEDETIAAHLLGSVLGVESELGTSVTAHGVLALQCDVDIEVATSFTER